MYGNVLVAVLSILPIARRAVGAPADPKSVVVPYTTNFDLSKIEVVAPINSDPDVSKVNQLLKALLMVWLSRFQFFHFEQ